MCFSQPHGIMRIKFSKPRSNPKSSLPRGNKSDGKQMLPERLAIRLAGAFFSPYSGGDRMLNSCPSCRPICFPPLSLNPRVVKTTPYSCVKMCVPGIKGCKMTASPHCKCAMVKRLQCAPQANGEVRCVQFKQLVKDSPNCSAQCARQLTSF